jgi:hypothetical protein
VENIGVGSRGLLVGEASDIQICCQKIDISETFDEIMGTKLSIFSAYVIAFGK